MKDVTRILVLTDNQYLLGEFRALVSRTPELSAATFTYRCSPASAAAMAPLNVEPVRVKTEWKTLTAAFDLVISAHCKQLFPAEMVAQVRCVNIHPGLNPYNRGWFPQVFSILNKLPLGATIHEIDAELDHGPIIAQQAVPVYAYDTSLTAYERVQAAELALLEQHLVAIVRGEYQTFHPASEGNLQLKKDYDRLCTLNLDEPTTLGQAIDRLRALTHGRYRNAHFYDAEGNKIYVSIVLEPEEKI